MHFAFLCSLLPRALLPGARGSELMAGAMPERLVCVRVRPLGASRAAALATRAAAGKGKRDKGGNADEPAKDPKVRLLMRRLQLASRPLNVLALRLVGC